MKYLVPLMAAFALLFVACDGGSATTQDPGDLESRVMAIHDEVMPKMGEVNRLSQELRKEIDARQARGDASEAQMAEMQEAVDQLSQANEAMSSWMRNYSRDYVKEKEHMTEEERIAYLQHELDRVEQVKTTILESIEQAKSIK